MNLTELDTMAGQRRRIGQIDGIIANNGKVGDFVAGDSR